MSIAKIKIEKSLIVWALLLGVSFGMVCWYGGQFLKQFYIYKTLSSEIPAQITAWGVDKVKEGKFVVYAKYSYRVNEQTFAGMTTFKKITFNNQLAAKEHLKNWKTESWTVYYHPKHPEISTLQRPFPLKLILHVLIGMGVSIYFLYLKRYLAAFRMT